MTARHRVLAALIAATFILAASPLRANAADDYSNAAWRDHDLDNVTRPLGRQLGQLTDASYHKAFNKTAVHAFIEQQRNQIDDLSSLRVYATLAQLLPGGAVGDPQKYFAMTPQRIHFLSRTGAKLSGRIWSNGAPGPRPGVVITTGSIQGTEHMYWWAARTLAAAGYIVMTWDVQGQGESETTGHVFDTNEPTGDGVPFQQQANFREGTIDALRFFFSTPTASYVPATRTAADAAAAKRLAAQNYEHLDWVNPAWGSLDRSRLGLAGHSAGAGAVSAVQQCSDKATLWRTLALCAGRSYPIRAVVGWDSLSSSVTPVVPGMNLQADGYFLNPAPANTPPPPDDHLTTHNRWKRARLDTFSVTVRGGTHVDFAEIPYILPATAYGRDLADFYTLAWMDRYVKGDTRAAARLLNGPRDRRDPNRPWNAHHFSTRYKSAFFLGGREVVDLRRYAGLSPVGDWAGSNADRVGRVLP